MAAGDNARLREGSLNGLNFELWELQSNGTTAITLNTKLKSVSHVGVTAAEDIGTTNSNAQYSASGGVVTVKFTDALADKRHTVMVWGLI